MLQRGFQGAAPLQKALLWTQIIVHADGAARDEPLQPGLETRVGAGFYRGGG